MTSQTCQMLYPEGSLGCCSMYQTQGKYFHVFEGIA